MNTRLAASRIPDLQAETMDDEPLKLGLWLKHRRSELKHGPLCGKRSAALDALGALGIRVEGRLALPLGVPEVSTDMD